MFLLVHANAILAGRGSLLFLQAVHTAVNYGGFDAMCQRARDLFDQLVKISGDVAKMQGHELEARNELLLVGPSAHAGGRIVGRWFKKDGASPLVEEDAHPTVVTPWDSQMPYPGDPCSIGAMVWLARAQARFIRERAPEQAGGGQFIVAEIWRHRMAIAPACELL
jgi:hypothetical protein